MNLYFESLGCAKNLVDSEVMLGRLKQAGVTVCQDPYLAEVIVVNTCSFIESAANESIDTILELAKQKKTGRCRRLIVSGCLPQRYGKEIAEALGEVDVFLGTGAFDQIVAAVTDTTSGSVCLMPDPNTITPLRYDTPRNLTTNYTAYLKIAEGCDRQCTYCIIPKLRGYQRSRSISDIICEAELLIESGVKEIVLVAQESTSYGNDLKPQVNLNNLLLALAHRFELLQQPDPLADAVSAAPLRNWPKIWFRVLYAHPATLTDAMIRTIARHSVLCNYFDVPVQHASNAVLKKMGRRYTRQDLYRVVKKIRSLAPEAAIRTTVMVGFPGETEDDFQQLVDFANEVRFDHLGVFIYSDSEDLVSHKLSNPVPASVAQKRRHILMTRQAEISAARNFRFIGKTLQVIIEQSPEAGLYVGRTAFQAPEVDGVTYIKSDALSVEEFAAVKITGATTYDLQGEAIR